MLAVIGSNEKMMKDEIFNTLVELLAVASSRKQVSFATETSQYRLCARVPAALPALIFVRRNRQASLAWRVSYCLILPSLKNIKNIINNRDHGAFLGL